MADGKVDQGQVQDPADPQGHRHRGGREDRGRSRRRLDLRLKPRRTAARPRPGLDACAAEIVQAVAGRAKIMVDGSICRGTDIVKAIASGADLVGIGRLQCWALAAAGEAGIVRMLELLEDEVVRCLGLLGVTSFAELEQILSACGDADQSAERVQRLPAAGYRTLSLLRRRPHRKAIKFGGLISKPPLSRRVYRGFVEGPRSLPYAKSAAIS